MQSTGGHDFRINESMVSCSCPPFTSATGMNKLGSEATSLKWLASESPASTLMPTVTTVAPKGSRAGWQKL
jgi:hypothetical protein